MKVLKLGDAVEYLLDHRGKTPKKLGGDFVAAGVPVASAMLVRGGRLHLAEARYVTPEMHRKWMPQPTRAGDVLLTSEGPLGRVARVPDNRPLVLGQRLFALRGRVGVLDSGYLYYALQTERLQSQLIAHATGTTVHGIRQASLRQLELLAPGYTEQRAIAEVLSALDDKISANHHIAATVDNFLANEFELRLRSDDWSTVALGDVAEVNASLRRPGPGTVRYIDISSVGDGRLDYPGPIAWSDAPSRARRMVRVGDTLWSTVRPNRRSHALLLDDPSDLVGSTGLAVLTPRDIGFAYLYQVTHRIEFGAHLETVAEGSAYPAVRADRFAAAPIPLLGESGVRGFEELAAPLRQRVHAAEVENRFLAATRDALLPALMSGALRVKDAERLAEDVT